MKFTYTDEEYDLVDPNDWTTLEAMQLARYTDMRPRELVQDLRMAGAFGLHAAVWISLRRAGLDIAWDSLQLPVAETQMSLRGEPVDEPPDPSTASTRRRSASRAGRTTRAQSTKS